MCSARCVMLVDIQFLFQFLLELILASIEREIFGFFQDRKHFRELTIGNPIVNSRKCLRSWKNPKISRTIEAKMSSRRN